MLEESVKRELDPFPQLVVVVIPLLAGLPAEVRVSLAIDHVLAPTGAEHGATGQPKIDVGLVAARLRGWIAGRKDHRDRYRFSIVAIGQDHLPHLDNALT